MTNADMQLSVTLYRRPGCHLCDTAEELLAEAIAAVFHGDHEPSVARVDVSADAALEARYGHLLPVIAVGDAAIELVTTGGPIRRLLRQAQQPARAS